MVGNWGEDNKWLRSDGHAEGPGRLHATKQGWQQVCFLTCDFGKLGAVEGEARHHSTDIGQHALHVVFHPGHHIVIRHGRPVWGCGMKGRRGKKVRQRRGIPALIPVSGICRASTAAAASNTKQEQEERDEDGSSQSCVVCQTCVGKMGCVSTDGSTAASLSQVRMSRTLTQHQGVTLGLLLLNMQLPCAGWQVPREHWQGEEQFTPKKPSGQVSLQLKERGKEEKCPQDQQLPALLPILPGSPVASLAEAVT